MFYNWKQKVSFVFKILIFPGIIINRKPSDDFQKKALLVWKKNEYKFGYSAEYQKLYWLLRG